MQVIHKLKMDLLRQNNTQIIDAVQLDSNTRKLELSLYEGAMPWAVPDGVLVAIAYMCDDGTRGVYDTLPDDSTAYEIDGNKITITIIPDALAVVGETKMTIIVSSSESKEDSIATFPLTFRVAENYSVDAKDPEGYVNLRGWLESEIDKILGAQVVVDIGWIETNQNVLINTTAKTITIGSGAVITVGNKKYDIGDIVFDISDFSSGAFVYFDPVSRKLFRKYESGMVYIGALWTPFYMQDLRVDKNRVLVDGMPVSFSSRFLGKTVNVLGDSMTEGVGLTGDDKPYHYWLKQLCGFKTVNNYGVGGSCISPKTDEVVEWDTVESFYERYSVMADGADAVVVFGSVNDWVYGHELGTISDTGTDTFYGTMKALCEGLREKYPAADLYFFGSPQNDYVHRRANTLTGELAGNNEGYNRKGYKLQDYNSAMSDVCAIYGIPFCDMSEGLWWGLSGVLGIYRGNDDGTSIPGILGIDSLHPNAEGHKKMALKMAGFINGGGVSSSGICSGNSTGGSDGDGYTLPVATPNRLGGVKPVAKTEDMTEPVGVDGSGGLWTVPGGGSGGINPPETAAVGQTIVVKSVDENGKPTEWEAADLPVGGGGDGGFDEALIDFTTEETVSEFQVPIPHELDSVLKNASEHFLCLYIPRNTEDTATSTVGKVSISITTSWKQVLLSDLDAIPAPTETWTEEGCVLAFLRTYKTGVADIDKHTVTQCDCVSTIYGKHLITKRITGALYIQPFAHLHNTNYFIVEGTQEMYKGTRFILGVRR